MPKDFTEKDYLSLKEGQYYTKLYSILPSLKQLSDDIYDIWTFREISFSLNGQDLNYLNSVTNVLYAHLQNENRKRETHKSGNDLEVKIPISKGMSKNTYLGILARKAGMDINNPYKDDISLGDIVKGNY